MSPGVRPLPAREIDRQRQQMSGLQVSFEVAGIHHKSVFRRLVYGFHPTGCRRTGRLRRWRRSRATIRGVSPPQLQLPTAILAIVGDITDDEAFGAVKKVFGGWERRDVPAPPSSHRPSRHGGSS